MRKNYVLLTFKKEMAIKLDYYYKTLKYKNYKINKTELVQNIMNQDNYTNYDFYLFVADYCKINMVILDIINYKYLYINYHNNNLLPTNNNKNPDKNHIIVKYTNNIFLPIMSSNGTHEFNIDLLDVIKSQFELDTYKYKERNTNDMFIIDETSIDNIDESCLIM